MKKLNTYINEKLVLNKNTFKQSIPKYFPGNKTELADVITELYDENNKKVDFDIIDVSKIKSFTYLFSDDNLKSIASSLTVIDLSSWDLSNATDIHGMLANCKNTTDIYLPLKLNDKLEDMSFLFHGCEKLKNIHNLEYLHTDKVTTFENMFALCQSLEILDVSTFKTDKLQVAADMFSHCYNLIEIKGLQSWNCEYLNDMENMFCWDESLEHIGDISGWKPKLIKTMKQMFYYCRVLKDVVDLRSWKISPNVTEITNWNANVSDRKNFKL